MRINCREIINMPFLYEVTAKHLILIEYNNIMKKQYNTNFFSKFLTSETTSDCKKYITISNLSSYQCSNVHTEPLVSSSRQSKNVPLNLSIKNLTTRSSYYSNKQKQLIKQLENKNKQMKPNAESTVKHKILKYSHQTIPYKRFVHSKQNDKQIIKSSQKSKSKQKKKNKITEIKVVITEEETKHNNIDNKVICKTEESKVSNRITKVEFIKNKYRTLLSRMAL